MVEHPARYGRLEQAGRATRQDARAGAAHAGLSPRAIQNLTVVAPGERAPTLRGVNLTVEPGQALGVIGPSARQIHAGPRADVSGSRPRARSGSTVRRWTNWTTTCSAPISAICRRMWPSSRRVWLKTSPAFRTT